ncbi:UNVERIFIED_CONTAM: hypothetical protein Slati_1288700 [Sesamum latifolium]|uniref:Uncharacterized protein n=1 Tax=Sesamum latifolium TaxID=2727402 RepID=A0AAW2XJS7_9LAMI
MACNSATCQSGCYGMNIPSTKTIRNGHRCRKREFPRAAESTIRTASASSARLTKPSPPPTPLLLKAAEIAEDSVPIAFGVICSGSFASPSLRTQ